MTGEEVLIYSSTKAGVCMYETSAKLPPRLSRTNVTLAREGVFLELFEIH